MYFTKMEATGNDFVLIEAGETEQQWSKLAVALCDRHYGVGADGLILVLTSSGVDARMRMFNPDGSEAEMCGNGLRCFAKYILYKSPVDFNKKEIVIETKTGIKKVTPVWESDKLTKVKVNMGKPMFSPAKIPVIIRADKSTKRYTAPVMDFPIMIGKRKLSMTFISMGNPHAVYFSREPVDKFPLGLIGPKVENYEAFPKRINFEIANVVGQKKVKARVWERGAGETLSCGTGACAIAVAAILHGYTDTVVEIELPGGSLEVEWNGKDEVFMSGPANYTFKGEWLGKV